MIDQNKIPQTPKTEKPQKLASPQEANYNQLLAQYQALLKHTAEEDRNRMWYRIALTAAGAFAVYFCWACEWVSKEFLLGVGALSIAVIAYSLGVLWEKGRRKEVDRK